MIIYRKIEIEQEGDFFITHGLRKIFNYELKVSIRERIEKEYIDLLYYLIDYILENNSHIKSGQTIAYYSWLLQFIEEDFYYVLWEAKDDGDGFLKGVDYAIKVLCEQKEECLLRKVLPVFPTFSQNIVISKGVYEGEPINGVRYPSPEHMTGWWLTTDLYDENINSLLNVHYFHVAFKRPDILRYLALPFEYRFYVSNEEQSAWHDENVS